MGASGLLWDSGSCIGETFWDTLFAGEGKGFYWMEGRGLLLGPST